MAQTNAERLAERKRVDEFMSAAQAKRSAAKGSQQAKPKEYPASIRLMGQGFKNLYDVLSGRSFK